MSTMDAKAEVDEIWKTLGTWGRYQIFQLVIMMVSLVPVSFPLLVIVFIGYTPPHQCRNLTKPLYEYQGYYTGVEDNQTSYNINYGQCNIDVTVNVTNGSTIHTTLPCLEGYDFSTDRDRTIVTEWNLVCTRKGLGELSQTLVTVGQALGATFFTSLSDRYGRKPVFIFTHLCLFIVSLILAFVPTYPTFGFLRLAIGTLQQGVGLSSATICVEIVPRECRGTIGTIGALVWTTCVVLLTPVGYFLRNYSWRYVQLAVALTSIHSLFAYWLVDESLRWLIANNKKEEAVKLVRKAAKWNKIQINTVLPVLRRVQQSAQGIREVNINEADAYVPVPRMATCQQSDATSHSLIDSDSNTSIERYTVFSILKHKTLLKMSLILWYTWWINNLTYYGLFLSSSTLAGNRFLNYFLNALVEFPSAIAFWLLINRVGRKKTSITFHAVAGFSLIISVVLLLVKDENGVARTMSSVFTFIGKFGITASFSTIFLYTPELYPTNLRNSGIGIASAASRVGGMAAPYVSLLATYALWAPGVIFGSCCLLITALTLFLPETRGRELPQTLDELTMWYKQQAGFFRKKKRDKTEELEMQ